MMYKIYPLTLPRHSRKQIAPAVGAAIVSGVGNLFGGFLSGKSNEDTNRTNLQIARETNAMNYKMWQEQRDYNTEMWNMSNEYNTPAAQFERLKAAGMSDWAAAQAVSGSVSQATPMSAPSAAPAQGATMIPTDFSFLGAAMDSAVSKYQETKLRDEQIRLASAQADKAETEAAQAGDYYRDFFRDITRSQLDNSLYDQHNKRHDATLKLQSIGLNAATYPNVIKQSGLTSDIMTADLASKELENTARDLENRMNQLRFVNLPKELAAGLALIAAQEKAAIASGAASYAQARNSIAQALYTDEQNKTWKLSNKHAETLADEALKAAYANTTLLQIESGREQIHWNKFKGDGKKSKFLQFLDALGRYQPMRNIVSIKP